MAVRDSVPKSADRVGSPMTDVASSVTGTVARQYDLFQASLELPIFTDLSAAPEVQETSKILG